LKINQLTQRVVQKSSYLIPFYCQKFTTITMEMLVCGSRLCRMGFYLEASHV